MSLEERTRVLAELGLAPLWVRRAGRRAAPAGHDEGDLAPLTSPGLDAALAAQARLMIVGFPASRHDAERDAARLLEQMLFAIGVEREAVFASAAEADGAAQAQARQIAAECEALAPAMVLVLGEDHRALAAQLVASGRAAAWLPHPRQLLGDAAGKRTAWRTLLEVKRRLG